MSRFRFPFGLACPPSNRFHSLHVPPGPRVSSELFNLSAIETITCHRFMHSIGTSHHTLISAPLDPRRRAESRPHFPPCSWLIPISQRAGRHRLPVCARNNTSNNNNKQHLDKALVASESRHLTGTKLPNIDLRIITAVPEQAYTGRRSSHLAYLPHTEREREKAQHVCPRRDLQIPSSQGIAFEQTFFRLLTRQHD